MDTWLVFCKVCGFQPRRSRLKSTRALQAAEKLTIPRHEREGHEFTRAGKRLKTDRTSAPAARFAGHPGVFPQPVQALQRANRVFRSLFGRRTWPRSLRYA